METKNITQSVGEAYKAVWTKRLIEVLDEYKTIGKQTGYKALKERGLHENSSHLAQIALEQSRKGAKVVSLAVSIGTHLSPDDKPFSQKEILCVGYYLIYCLTKAGIYQLRTEDGYTPWGNWHGNRSPYELAGTSSAPDMSGAISRRPFERWLSEQDSVGRRLVHSRAWQPSKEEIKDAEYVRAINHLEAVPLQVNNNMLALYEAFGSQKKEGDPILYMQDDRWNKKGTPPRWKKGDNRKYTEGPRKGEDMRDRTAIEHDDDIFHSAKTYANGPLHIRHFLDHRGRVYTSASRLNLQDGGDLARGLLEFRRPTLLDKDGIKAILLSTANHYGLKGHSADRLEKARELLPAWQEIGQDPIGQVDKWTSSDSPWQFVRHCIELATKRIGDESHLAVEIDQSCSALAWVAMFERDKELAKLTNLGMDYNDVYVEVGKALNINCTPDEARNIAKCCALPYNYGSGERTIAERIWDKRIPGGYVDSLKGMVESDGQRVPSDDLNDLTAKAVEALDKAAPAQIKFKKRLKEWAEFQLTPKPYTRAMKYNLLERVIELKAPESIITAQRRNDRYLAIREQQFDEFEHKYKDFAAQAKKDGQPPEGIFSLEYPGQDYLEWQTPTGFHVRVEKPQLWPGFREQLHWVEGERSGHIKPMYQRPTNRPRIDKLLGSVMANAIHSLDASLVHRVADRADFDLAVIHDAFLTTPANLWKMQRLLLECLQSLEEELPHMSQHFMEFDIPDADLVKSLTTDEFNAALLMVEGNTDEERVQVGWDFPALQKSVMKKLKAKTVEDVGRVMDEENVGPSNVHADDYIFESIINPESPNAFS